MSKKIGIIDVGTNTINLLIVSKKMSNFDILHKDRQGVGLGHGGINQGIITHSAFERGVECLKSYADVCKSYETTDVIAFGTSALRHANNANDFIKEVKSISNIDIKVITGDTEAELIYKGISLIYDFKLPALIMDIGGGSTEFIAANKNGIINKTSLEIGVSRIHQYFKFSNPFTKWDIYQIDNYLNEHISQKLDAFNFNTLIGSSGSFKTFYELAHQQTFNSNSCESIHMDQFLKVIDMVIHSTLDERKSNPLIHPIRYEMLPIAAVKVKWIIDRLGIENINISPYSLKEGIIFSN
jgi:exopolyphosphatase/guanosine-5'-triphosphate,3'-diphosphate pyrophosphatase